MLLTSMQLPSQSIMTPSRLRIISLLLYSFTRRRHHLLGVGYPLLPRLTKPFAFSSVLTPKQKEFNYRLSRARIVVENAFGRLKARWRHLLKQNDMVVTNVPKVVTAFFTTFVRCLNWCFVPTLHTRRHMLYYP